MTEYIPVRLVEVDDSVKQFDHGAIRTKTFDIVLQNGIPKIGGITLRCVDNEYLSNYRGHVGFYIDREYRCRGYATSAVNQVLKIAQAFGMKRVVIACNTENVASERTICKAGLKYETTVVIPKHTYLWNHGIKQAKRFSVSLPRSSGEEKKGASS